MKKINYLAAIGVFASLLGCSNDGETSNDNTNPMQPIARTVIADAAFEEALVELDIDDVVDGSVVTGRVEMVTSLVLNDKGITSLQGITDFSMLENLRVDDNQISSLDLSQNTLLKFIFAENNVLTSINVSNLNILEKLAVTNNNLTQLDISDNGALQVLQLADNTLGAIDISGIPNNLQLNTFAVENNPLTCIQVNQEILNDIPSQWSKDEADTYALSCN
ncbi:hypothetical protein [Muriicola sp.]|uniref:hypothetical protein n=1 Tax=Muriicola sp. TaxID=2020856 RepID=UPI003C761EC7